MERANSNQKQHWLQNIQHDLPAGLVVFLVATPLCLGIALASGAPFFSGLLAGMIGGLVIPLVSRSQMSVSGPAAGLTAVVLIGIQQIGSFEGFILAVLIAGVIQISLGLFKAGFIAYYIPNSVIKGMLTAIGLILILKQLPHAIGYDFENFAAETFQITEDENTFTLLYHSFRQIEFGALAISAVSLFILIFWEKTPLVGKIKWMPSALVVVIFGILANELLFKQFFPEALLLHTHLVNIPPISSLTDFAGGFTFPNFSFITNQTVWITGITIGLVASIETLLTIEAVDKLDPYRRRSPLNRELIAQGVGNSVAGLLGGLPITSVIVRSSAGINSGGRTNMMAFYHGVFLLVSVLFLSQFLNMIPMAALAAILLTVGYKLAKPSLFIEVWKKGLDQFVPYIVTVVAILLSDLLIGVSIGVVVGLFFVIRNNFHMTVQVFKMRQNILIKFNRDVSFLNKALLMEALATVQDGTSVLIDGTKARFVDKDILDVLEEFEKEAHFRNITVEYKNLAQETPAFKPKLDIIDVV